MNGKHLLLMITMMAGSALLQAQSTPSDSLLILSKHDSTLAIVDPATLKVLARVPVGPDPHEVIASSDGTTAYASNYGFGTYHSLGVVDLTAQKALPPVDLGALRGPHGLDFVGGKVWFTAEVAKAIGRYDPASGKVDWILGTGQNRTHMLYVYPDEKRIITANVNSGTIGIIEKKEGGTMPPGSPLGGPSSGSPNSGPPNAGPPPGSPPVPPGGDWDETLVPVGVSSEGFDVSPDGKTIWSANSREGTVAVIDVAEKKVVRTLQANVRGANRVKFTLDGKLAFIASLSSPELAIFDAASGSEVKRLKIGHGGAGILMQPDGTRAYVACSPDDYVVVIDLKSLTVVAHIEAGKQPDGLAWAARH